MMTDSLLVTKSDYTID